MSWRYYADLAQEVILDTFAERDADGAVDVTYEPAGGTPRVIRGIFREPHVDLVLEPFTPAVSTWQVRLGVKIAELLPDWPIKEASRFVVPRPPGGNPLDRSTSARYRVADRRLDGEGMAELYLQRKD